MARDTRGGKRGGKKNRAIQSITCADTTSRHATYDIMATEVGEIMEDELLKYNGTDPSLPIYVAIRKRIFDVSSAKSFYGPGGSYAVFAGKDASRALAKMSTKEHDVVGSLEGLTEKEMTVLADWERKFEAKYPVVGTVA
ncbi:hypothetical protein GOP47_0028191 [Adiantum capillus-veneris]|nr:hypothetical protein GOP47_0028191 [Adiantum capillus-veneris]